MAKSKRINLAKKPIQHLEANLLETQTASFGEFRDKGFEGVFNEINPVTDYTGSSWELSFEKFEWGDPKHSFRQAQKLGLTYDAPISTTVKLINKRTGEIKKQKLFLTDMPLMGDRASFMVNGNERVVSLQIIRSEGVLFVEAKNSKPKKRLYMVKLMPERGKWFDFEVNKYGVMSVKLLDKHPKILLTTLLRALGYSTTEEVRKHLEPVDNGETSYLEATLKKDPTHNTEEALLEIYRKLRPEDTITVENARDFLYNMFFNKSRFYLGKIGRYKLNEKLGFGNGEDAPKDYLLRKEDVLELVKALIQINTGERPLDDIDSLMNRRIRSVGESISEKVRMGVKRMEKNIKDRMAQFSTEESITPSQLINTRPVSAAIIGFFGGSALSRYMDQENILSEIVIKQKITAGGPRGLTKERATFSVRDIHNSHYSRICPVHTPEGPSIGMVLHLAIYARVNEYGFLEAPYMQVANAFNVKEDKVSVFKGRKVSRNVEDETGKVVVKEGTEMTSDVVAKAKKAKIEKIPVVPFMTGEVQYLDAAQELEHRIASASVTTDDEGNLTDARTYVRDGKTYMKVDVSDIDFVDVNTAQIGGVCLSLIPFASLDDPNRTFYGAKTLTQSVPLVHNQSPIVGTGFERMVVKASGRTLYAEDPGVVKYADAAKVIIEYKPKEGKKYEKEYEVEKFVRTNNSTSFSQKSVVKTGDKLAVGDVIIDGPNTMDGELALGVNLRTAYLQWEGYNYEDAMVISDRLVKDDILTSVHIHEYSQEIRETKLGDEQITRDIPNVGEYALRNLAEDGIVRIGASVEPNDILVGIIAPKGETELTAEEKLLRAIFGEYARDVRDNSMRLPHGESGVVVKMQVLDRASGAKLNPGVLKQVKVWVASTHKITVGDKLTGFHGGKGVIGKILPQEDMPFTEDGRPVDIILGPQSMVRRMNMGQLMEAHVGELASKLGVKVEVPPFSQFTLDPLLDLAKKEGVEYQEKMKLFDGRTGQPFDQDVVVGTRYFIKLEHMADFKVHARSTGPYTMVTQQPLGGRAQRGGQRFGEMEVWALEAHGVPTVLHEMLTIKSDDVVGRSAAYKSIISGTDISTPSIPESFNVFDRELAALGIKLEKINAVEDSRVDSTGSLEEVVDQLSQTDSKAPGSNVAEALDEKGDNRTVETEMVNDENFEIN